MHRGAFLLNLAHFLNIVSSSPITSKSTVNSTSGLHKSFHHTIQDLSTESKFGACGEHGPCALVLREPCSGSQRTVPLVFREPCTGSQRTVLCMFVEGKSRTVFFLQTLLFMAFFVTIQKIITYALVST